MAADPLRARLSSGTAFAGYRAAFTGYSRDVHRRLHGYVETLPPSGRDALSQVGSAWFADDPGQGIIKPYPVFTAEFFGIADAEVIGRASLASNLMQLHCWLQDSRIDGDWPAAQCAAATDALSNILLTDSLSIFADLAADTGFWPIARASFCELSDAYAAEASPNAAGDGLIRDVLGRSAPFHILVAALGLHARRTDLIQPCTEMANRLLLWFQILDDLSDWREDHARGRRSYAMSLLDRFIGSKPLAECTADDIADALYLFGGAEALIAECVRLLGEALDLLRRHTPVPRAGESATSFHCWLPLLIDGHEKVRLWSIQQKSEFLQRTDSCA